MILVVDHNLFALDDTALGRWIVSFGLLRWQLLLWLLRVFGKIDRTRRSGEDTSYTRSETSIEKSIDDRIDGRIQVGEGVGNDFKIVEKACLFFEDVGRDNVQGER